MDSFLKAMTELPALLSQLSIQMEANTKALTLLKDERDALQKKYNADRLLTIQEARAYLGGVSEDTLLYYRNRYKLPFIKKGQGSTWYRKGDIDAWLEEGRLIRRTR